MGDCVCFEESERWERVKESTLSWELELAWEEEGEREREEGAPERVRV